MNPEEKYNEALKRLAEAQTSHWSVGYENVITEAGQSFWAGETSKCIELLDTLPTVKSLLSELEVKLKGKRLHQSLKQFREGKVKSRASRLKIVSSLLTHCAIECEKGNVQFERLIPNIVEQLNTLAYGESHVHNCRPI